jgi:hypothetical protein
MKVLYVDAFLRHISTNSRYLIYASVVGLASLDVLSTFAASIVMGRFFVEVGLVANVLMSVMPDSWPVLMFFVESIMFGTVAFFMTRGKSGISSLKVLRWKLPLGYLPSIALSFLVLNNTMLVIIFAIPLIQ